MGPRSLSARITLIAGLLTALILLLGGILLSLFVRDLFLQAFDQRLVEVLEGVIAASEVEAQSGALSVDRGAFFQAGLDARGEQPLYAKPYWQIGDPAAAASRLLPEGIISSHILEFGWALAIPSGIGSGDYTPVDREGPGGQSLRVFARTIRLPGAAQRVPYLVAGDQRVVQDRIARFDAILLAALAGLGLCLVSAIFVQVRVGLQPLRRVGRRLAAIRRGDAERLEGDYPSEIALLTGELNALLDHNRDLVERGRRQIGDMAHVLKTPLAVLTNEADRGRPLDPGLVGELSAGMRQSIDRYLSRARIAASRDVLGATTPVAPVIERLRGALARLYGDRAIAIEVDCAEGLQFLGEREDLSEMLGNLADNACKWASARVRIGARAKDGRLLLAVEDDGPGLPEARREEMLRRGTRLGEEVLGSGLGLSITQEIAEAYGGEIALEEADLGGLRAHLALPLAPRAGGG